MHKILQITGALAAALAFAAPAVAQYYPGTAPDSGYAWGSGRGIHGDWQQVRQLRVEIDGIRRQIDRLDRNGAIRGRTADHFLEEANRIDRRLSDKARDGLDSREAGDIQYRVQRLEQQIQWSRNGRWGDSHGWR